MASPAGRMELQEGEEATTVKQVTVGICAMEKKTLSKPMKEILTRLEEFEYITTCIFPENVILEVGEIRNKYLHNAASIL